MSRWWHRNLDALCTDLTNIFDPGTNVVRLCRINQDDHSLRRSGISVLTNALAVREIAARIHGQRRMPQQSPYFVTEDHDEKQSTQAQ
jgi:hypothetical protein